jgi:hypothetical protein
MILKSGSYRCYDYKWPSAYRRISGNSKIQESIVSFGFSVVTNSAHHKSKRQPILCNVTDSSRLVDRFTFHFSSRHRVGQINSVQSIRLNWTFLYKFRTIEFIWIREEAILWFHKSLLSCIHHSYLHFRQIGVRSNNFLHLLNLIPFRTAMIRSHR